MKKYSDRIYLDNSKINQRNAVAILLMAVGVFLVCNPISNTIRIGVALTIIGFFLFVLKTEEKTAHHSKELQIMFIMITWTIVVYLVIVITDATVDILFILVLIGLLVTNELIPKVISVYLRKRINFACVIFFMVVVILIIRKIISMSRM